MIALALMLFYHHMVLFFLNNEVSFKFIYSYVNNWHSSISFSFSSSLGPPAAALVAVRVELIVQLNLPLHGNQIVHTDE